MKRFLRFFLGAAAAACLCVSALAAASADLVRTFVYDGTLFRRTWSSSVLFSTVMSPKDTSWKVVVPSWGMR